jgi:hypothetical protein
MSAPAGRSAYSSGHETCHTASYPASCTHCTRPTINGVTLCSGCTTRLRTILRSIPDVMEQLHITLARLDKIAPQNGARSADTAVVFKETASATLADLRAVLTSWTSRPPATTCVAQAAWLLAQEPFVRRHPAAGRLLTDLDRVTKHAFAVVDLPEDLVRCSVGPCPERDEHGSYCRGEVWANVPRTMDRPAMLRCRGCATEWDTTQWKRAGQRIQVRRAELEQTVAARGVQGLHPGT